MTWWQREYEELLRAHQKAHGNQTPMRFDVRLATLPKPKLSDILRCARIGKEQPGVWREAQAQAVLPDEVWDDDECRPRELLPFFAHWYRFKHGLEGYLPDAFVIDPIIRAWAHPDFDGDEVTAARKVLKGIPWRAYVDDLADGSNDEEFKA